MVLEKLRGRSARELWVRGKQFAFVVLERAGIPIPEGKRPRLRRSRTPLVPHAPDLSAAAERVAERWPTEADRLIAAADAALDGKFEVLGHDALDFGQPTDWHRDPVLGRSAPRVHWSRVPFLDAQLVGDHKVIWELNRQQHLVTLAQAYWITRDGRYARGVRDLQRAWAEANPVGMGINWASSLELALRSISWLWAYRMLEPAGMWNPDDDAFTEATLARHGTHILRNLSTYFSPNTHLTGEALGLMYLGANFQGHVAERWWNAGVRILQDELARQIRADGTYYENSTWYHRYTTDFYLHAILLARSRGHTLPDVFERSLPKLVDYLVWLTLPDGTTPLMGDDDGGYLVKLEKRRPNDFRSTIALATALRPLPEWRAVAGESTAGFAWMVGPEKVDSYDRLPSSSPASTAKCFAAGPVTVLRDGWGSDASVVVMDGGVASAGVRAHGHASALAVTVAIDGKTIATDPGTYSYVQPDRDLFRGVAAHSTLIVAGHPSPVPTGLFSWREPPTVELEEWHEGELLHFVMAVHRAPVEHRRSVLLVPSRHVLIVDSTLSSGAVAATIRFQAPPDCDVHVLNESQMMIGGPLLGARLTFAGDGQVRRGSSFVSTAYGSRQPASFAALELPSSEHHSVLTVVSRTDDRGSPRVRQRRLGTTTEYWIQAKGRTDYFAHCANGEHLLTEVAALDGSILWLSWDDTDEGELQYFGLGRSLTLHATQTVIEAGPGTAYLEGRVAHDMAGGRD